MSKPKIALYKKEADNLSQVSILTFQQSFILQYGNIWGFFLVGFFDVASE